MMLIIIILAFANLFFIIQLNIEPKDTSKYHYAVPYTKDPISSSIISMYMVAQGDFHFSGYG